jgi:(E)-4-hydroxy-3-methylbut-2-enyl-diphosphate synthase
VIADIHFNHTWRWAIDAGAHCIRLNPQHRRPGNGGGRRRATAAGVPMRIGVNSGSLPHLHELERSEPSRRWSWRRSSS